LQSVAPPLGRHDTPNIADFCALAIRPRTVRGLPGLSANAARMVPPHGREDNTMRMLTSAIAASVLLAGTIALGQTITYDYDKSKDFGRAKTYAWVRGTVVPDAFNHRRIVDAVNAQMGIRGLREVEMAANPDLFIAYHASFDSDLHITGFSSGWGGYRFGDRSGTARTEEILVGTLAVDIIDAATRTIVWRSIATKEIDVDASPDKRAKNITKAAEKLFAHYPVKPGRR
jgi:hypothetical protein